MLTRLIADLLFGISPLDVVTFIAGPVVLLLTSAVACLLPALQAASADPSTTLRG